MPNFDKIFGRPSMTVVIGTPFCTPKELGHDPERDGDVIYSTVRFLPRLLVELKVAKSASEVRRNRPDLCFEMNKADVVSVKYGRHLLYIIVGDKTISEHQIQWGDRTPKSERTSESCKYPTSLMIVYGDPEIYTLEEVWKIRIFSEELTRKHLKKWDLKDWGWNFFWLEKLEHGMWLSKRATHQVGRMFSQNLDSALEWFRFLADMLPDGYEVQHFQCPIGENGEMVPVKVSYDDPDKHWGRKMVPR